MNLFNRTMIAICIAACHVSSTQSTRLFWRWYNAMTFVFFFHLVYCLFYNQFMFIINCKSYMIASLLPFHSFNWERECACSIVLVLWHVDPKKYLQAGKSINFWQLRDLYDNLIQLHISRYASIRLIHTHKHTCNIHRWDYHHLIKSRARRHIPTYSLYCTQRKK